VDIFVVVLGSAGCRLADRTLVHATASY